MRHLLTTLYNFIKRPSQILILCLFSLGANAQNLTVTLTVPLSGEERFSICGGERLMTIRVENTTGAGGNTAVTLSNIVSSLNLSSATGIKFTGTLITSDKSSGLSDVTVNNASTPSFSIPDLAYTQYIEFKVGLSSDCGSLAIVKAGTKPKIPVNFTYTGGAGSYSKDSAPFEIMKPALSIPKVTGNFDPTANTFDAGSGVTDSITVQVTNAGSGQLSEFIYWVKDHAQLTLQKIKIGNVEIPAMGMNGDTTFFKITSAHIAQAFAGTGSPTNNTATFQFNESLNIKEIWFVDDCKSAPLDIQHGARYGCDNSTFPKCEETTKNTGVRFGLLRPLIENNWYYGFGDPYPGCGIAIAGQYLTNTGRVKATEINFDVKYWVPEYVGTGSLDLNNIYVQKKTKATGILGPLTKVTPSSLLEKVGNGCSPSTDTYRGAAIMLSSDFDLMPGDTLFVKWQQLPECQQACNPSSCELAADNYSLFGHSGITTSNYTDPCKLQKYLITYRSAGSLYARMPYFAEAPAVIEGGQTGTYSMTLTDFNVWKYTNHGSTRTDVQGNKNISNYPRRRIQFIYINEIGLDWNRGASDFTWTDNQGDTWTPSSVRYIDNQLSGNDTLIVTYTGNWPSNFNPAASNKIKVNYLGDCTEVPACVKSKVANLSSIIRFMPDSTCTDCSTSAVIGCKTTSAITVRCPSCEPCEGLTPISLKMERTNFEQPDNNNDFKPDATGSIDKNFVALNRAIAGDTITAIYKGIFNTGTNHTQWENSYNILQLPSSTGLTFTPLGGKLTIIDTDGSGNIVGTYHSTILQQYPSGNDVITNISPTNVASLSTTNIPPTFTAYGQGDSVIVEVRLVIADNAFNFTNDGNVFKSIDVGDASFASHVPIDQTNKPNIGTNKPNTEPKDRYQCDIVTSRFYYIEMYHNLESSDGSYPGGCTEGQMGYDWEGMFIGTRSVDFFPFEYRSPKGYETVAKFVKRSDLIYTKVEWQIYAKDYIGRPPKVGDVPLNSGNYGQTLGTNTPSVYYGVLPMNSPYVQVVGDTVYTYIDKFFKDNFGTIIADEGYRVLIRPYYIASCATVKSAQAGIRHYPLYNFKLDDKVFGYSDLKNVNRYAYRPFEGNYGKLLYTLGYGYAGGPTLTLQTSATQQELLGSEACFKVDIVNTSDYVANNTWITLTNASGAIQIKSVKEVNPSTGAVINTPIEDLGIYQLGNTTAAVNGVPKTRRFEVCVFADNCNKDSIKVNIGWDCLGYPKTVEEAACNSPVYLYTLPVASELDMIIKEPSVDITAPLCEEQSYIVQLSSAIVGTLNNINLQYELPSGMEMVAGSFQYLYPSPASGNPNDALASAWVTAPNQPINTFGSTYLVNATAQGHPILSTTGLVGTTDIGKNLMFVKFKVKTTCNFLSGSPINFLSWAYDACDKITNYRFSPSKKLNIQGAPEVYRTEISVDPTALNPCLGEKKTINAGFAILAGSVPTSGDDSVRVILPPGLSYSQTLSINNSQLTGPLVKTENGQEVIYWKVNPGLTGGTAVNWSFEIGSSDVAQACNQPYEIIVQTYRSSSASCNGNVCSIRILSDEARGSVSFIKPNLSITAFSAGSKAMPPSQEEVSYSVTVINTGEAIPTGTSTKIEVYSDNGDGDITTSDVLLFTATTNVAIPNGGTAVITGTALVNAGTTCSLIALVNPQTTCTCNRAESFVVHPSLDVPFGPRTVNICSNTTSSSFGPTPLSNHTYNWIAINGANLTALSSTTTTPITFKLRNTGTSNQTHTYVLRTTRNNDCYVFDTLNVVVYPEIADSTSFTVCSNATFKLAGPSTGSAFQWTPTTNLSSSTDPQATVIGGVAAISTYTLNYLDAHGCPASYKAKINITDCGATAIGDTVWVDTNANGLQDIGEKGVENVVVYLYAGSNTAVPISSTTTNSAGYYWFNNLPQGYYRIGFVLPNGAAFTSVDSGSDDTKDSDADPTTGLTPQVFISNGISYPNYDAGIVLQDYGDAPNSYKTLKASDGPRHVIIDGLLLGTLIDADANAHNPATAGNPANGDDSGDSNDDEDGVSSFSTLYTISATYTVNVAATNTTGSPAYLVAWIDFNRNGTFEASEGVSVNVPTGTTNASIPINFTVPSNTVAGLTYARFRISNDAALTTAIPSGFFASGEVEDYELTISNLFDWGDNPASYQTDGSGGARHIITRNLYLGTTIDDETTGVVSVNSDGDDTNKAINDEDGVTAEILRKTATTLTVQIKATNKGATAAKVIGWIDFNNNSTYQSSEAMSVNIPANTIDGTFGLTFTIPSGTVLTENQLVYARFRLTTDAAITTSTPAGLASDGEVEDYAFKVICIKPSAGSDVVICLPQSTVKLANANTGETWFTDIANPTLTTINATTGSVSGITTAGLYHYILKNNNEATCSDTIQINVLDCSATAIGDTVWVDTNANGLQDIGEKGIESVKVYLYNDANPTVIIDSTTTNSAGYYLFNNLMAGSYHVRFVLPNGAVFTTSNTGSNDAKDSDANPITGLAPSVTVVHNTRYLSYDAGIIFYDYGDAPDTYKTSEATNGAKHTIIDGLRLGTLVDSETNANAPATAGNPANGDDLAGTDDEDGISTFASLFSISDTYSVNISATNNTTQTAYLVGWIDFNRNGIFEANEAATANVPTGTNNGTITLNFTLPSGTIAGLSYARFRISQDAALTANTPNGAFVSGEVEDYEITIETLIDWGDNPDSYKTDGNTGAAHVVTKYLYLGSTVDGEPAGNASTGSTGDNANNGVNDEDGVTAEILRKTSTSFTVQVTATNTGSVPAKIIGWIDFNNDGIYQSSEAVMITVPAGTNNGKFTLTFPVPSGSVLIDNQLVYGRFRLTTDAMITTSTPGGLALDGEVEDYAFMVMPCTKPNAGIDISICLPKTTVNLLDANINEAWILDPSNTNTASIGSTNGEVIGLGFTGTYQFILQNTSDAMCADTVKVTVEQAANSILICGDGNKNNSYTLTAPTSLIGVIWYNMAGDMVGSGYSLIVTPATKGLEDNVEAFYYKAGSSTITNCNTEQCCPQTIVVQACCPVPNCLSVTAIKK